MKKLWFIVLSFVAVQISAQTIGTLPKASQQFIKKYFPSNEVAFVEIDKEVFDTSYEVSFTNGVKIDFDKQGNWKEVDCKFSNVPNAIVPKAIRNYVAKKYPGNKIIQIEKKRKGGHEVKLSNGLELTFNKSNVLIEIDN